MNKVDSKLVGLNVENKEYNLTNYSTMSLHYWPVNLWQSKI